MGTNWRFFAPTTKSVRFMKGQAGGFYDSETAVKMAKKISDEEGGDYIVVANGSDDPIGYRLEPVSRVPIEIDLTWSELYKSFSDRAAKEVSLRAVYG